MSNQTSVEWLFHKLWNEPRDKMVWYALLNKAIQMHKEEVTDAYWDGGQDIPSHISTCENYYQETYGGNNES